MRYLVTGCRGSLGSQFMRRLGEDATGLDLPAFDITAAPALVTAAVRESGAEVVINCAAMTDVDACERDPGAAAAIHRDAVETLAGCAPRLVTFSTDHVFSGPREIPWLEGDVETPVNAYARSKLEGERLALARPCSLVVRTSWLFSNSKGLVPFLASRIAGGGELRAVTDQVACITYAPDLVDAVLRMISDGAAGLVHAASGGELTPFSLADYLGAGSRAVPVRWADLGLPAARPAYSALGTLSSYVLPGWQEAIERWRQEIE